MWCFVFRFSSSQAVLDTDSLPSPPSVHSIVSPYHSPVSSPLPSTSYSQNSPILINSPSNVSLVTRGQSQMIVFDYCICVCVCV